MCNTCKFKCPVSTIMLHSCESESIESLDLVCLGFSTPNPKQPSNDKVEIEIQTSPSIVQKSETTLENTMLRSLSSPLSKIEENVHTHLSKQKLSLSKDGTMKCKTRGQPMILKRLKKPRNQNSPLRKSRSKLLASIRYILSGKNQRLSLNQQSSEINILSKNTRKKLLEDAGITQNCFVSRRIA